jgi:hypothetical protein
VKGMDEEGRKEIRKQLLYYNSCILSYLDFTEIGQLTAGIIV